MKKPPTLPLAQPLRVATIVLTYTRFTIQIRPWWPSEAGPWIFSPSTSCQLHIGARGSIVD